MSVLFHQGSAIHSLSGHKLLTLDICLTGEHRVPVPYLNVALSSDAQGTATTVFVMGRPLCHQASYFSKSRGDEAGTHKGIRSRTVQGRAEFIAGSSSIFIEGEPAVFTGCLMVSNERNTPPAPVFL